MWKRFHDAPMYGVTFSSLKFLPLVLSMMQFPASRSFPSDASRARSSSDSFSRVRLPLETSPSDFDEAVRKLKQRPTDELRRARKHHRRALKALRNDGYEALPDPTRDRLIKRFQTNLTALNDVLERGSEDGEVGR